MHTEEKDKADLQMNRIQSDQNQTRNPVTTSQEGPTLGLKMMVTFSGKTFLICRGTGPVVTRMGCWSLKEEAWDPITSHRKTHFSPVQLP